MRAASHRRRPGLRLLVVLVVLLGLLVAADRISNAVAERAAADTLQQSQHLSQRPDVDITGFPFLTQLAAAEFDEIDVTANYVDLAGHGVNVRVEHLRVALHHVHVARDFSSARSESGTATALITYPQLSKSLGIALSYAGAGRIRATHDVSVLGADVAATATAGVRVEGDSLAFTTPRVAIEGQQVPPEVVTFFGAIFATTVPLGGLPFGVHVRSVTSSADGVTIGLTAGQLTFHR